MSNRSQHADAIARTIAFIEEHLSEHLDLERLADEAAYSKFYLHRLFTAMVGFSIHDYVLRRRLTEAARALVFTDRAVIDIALAAGYDGQQAFTSAFSALYKLPPAHFRDIGSFYPLQLPFEPIEGAAVDECGCEVDYAREKDVPAWMALMRSSADGFPCFDEIDHEAWIIERIGQNRVILAWDGDVLAGGLAFDPASAHVHVLAVRPQYRRLDVARTLLDALRAVEVPGRPVSITTYRKGDRADTGHRRDLVELGFEERGELVEFGYPTQLFVLPAAKEGGGEGADADGGDDTGDRVLGEERRRLEETLALVRGERERARALLAGVDGGYGETKRYVTENRGELDPAERFQTELYLGEVDRQAAQAGETVARLDKLLDAPYFAGSTSARRGRKRRNRATSGASRSPAARRRCPTGARRWRGCSTSWTSRNRPATRRPRARWRASSF